MHAAARPARLLAVLLVAAGCTAPDDKEPVDTAPVGEPDPYTISEGVPASTDTWRGHIVYSYVHPYEWGSGGPTLLIERTTVAAGFFPDARWGVFDLLQGEQEGCWTDAWDEGWAAQMEVAETVPAALGGEAITLGQSPVSDGILYTWRADTSPQEWAITPGGGLELDGVDTTVKIPEPLVVKDMANVWIDYDGGTALVMEWEPPTVEGTFLHVLRREEGGAYTRCRVKDDGAVSIEYGARRDRNDPRLFISRIWAGEIDHPTYGRVSAYAEDQILLDPG